MHTSHKPLHRKGVYLQSLNCTQMQKTAIAIVCICMQNAVCTRNGIRHLGLEFACMRATETEKSCD